MLHPRHVCTPDHRRPRRRAALVLGAALSLAVGALAACGDDDEPAGSSGGSGGTGGAAGADSGTGGTIDGGGGDATVEPPGPPEPLAVAEWMVTSVVVAQTDSVIPALEQGTFTLPAPGDYLGQTWAPVVPGPNGELIEDLGSDLIYAAARIQVPDGHRVFARGDTVAGFFVDTPHRQPGDFYHSRKLRVPLATRSGEALVVVRALGHRAAPEVQLWSTRAELHFNVEDVTPPDLVVGSTEARSLGIAVLNLLDAPVANLTAEVVDNASFQATTESFPSLAASSVTQLSFRLEPKTAPTAADQKLTARLRVTAPSLTWPYETDVEVTTVATGARYRKTRRSNVDGSTQYYAVMPPSAVTAGEKYGLILSLHGAGVEASGQAASYGPMAWAQLAAATNRRPFGFDWEEWGRLDALETLNDAIQTLPVDPLRVHLTGHSMGGHGSWHVGVHFADRFAVVGPSAGWISFDDYGGQPLPSGPVGRARAASKTLDFVGNLANDAVYIIHGSADDNVPVWHGQTMFSTLQPIVANLTYHEEPGAGHWWDLDAQEEGADCVDWPPLISLMEQSQRDPVPLAFDFTSPGPWVNPTHSFVTVRSVTSPMQNVRVTSVPNGAQVDLTTENVRSLVLDGAGLAQKGVTTVTVDGMPHAVAGAPIPIGPQTGKRPDLSGPFNQIYQKPFCFVWDDAAPTAYRDYAALLVSWWSLMGNGHACGLPRSALTPAIEADRNLIFLGVPLADAAPAGTLPFSWTAAEIDLGTKQLGGAVLAFVYPAGERLRAYVTATAGAEYLLFRYVPFSSRSGMPDFFAYQASGSVANGFFDADWKVDATFATGL